MVGGVGFYLIFVYAASYLTGQMHLSTAQALDINTANLFFMLILTAPAAMLSDRIGRKPMLFGVALGALVLAWPLWWLMHQHSFVSILAGQMGFALIFAVAFAVIPAVMAELLPPEVRCSGASIGYNLCLGIFGDTGKAARVIPNKVFQILSAGAPLITRDSPAIRELLSPDMPGVYLVPPADPDALLAAVREFRDTHGPKGRSLHREAAERIAPRAVGEAMRDAIARTLDRRGAVVGRCVE